MLCFVFPFDRLLLLLLLLASSTIATTTTTTSSTVSDGHCVGYPRSLIAAASGNIVRNDRRDKMRYCCYI
uniref:Putative secreted protein n=1 Tax=Anopheles darlingi TaxID=43151 RepID=A0A2M4D9F0_ANODA